MIYLDNSATTSPKPKSVIEAVNRAMRQYSANPGRSGHLASMRTAQAVYDTRTRVKEFFHCQSEENVIFTSGCTASLNTVIKGALKKGDHVVISSMEHNAVLRPLYALQEKGIISYSIAAVIPGDNDATVDSFRQAINERTRMIVCTHASNVFGTILPVRRICALAHQYGILFCLDAAQSGGVLSIDLDADKYDFICCAGHKGLYGIEGVGILLINTDAELNPLIEGGTGSASSSPDMPAYYPDRLESGTLNIPGILSMDAGLRLISQRGMDSIAEHEIKLIQRAYNSLKENTKIKLYSDFPTLDHSVPVLSFNAVGKSSEEVAAYLDQNYGIAVRAGLHCAPLAHKMMGTSDTGTVRISPGVFTTVSDIEKTVFGIHNFTKNS